MSWLILVIAGFFEIVWAIGLKVGAGFTRPWIVVVTLVALVVSFVLLGLAMRNLPVGTAYAVWTGIGVMGTALIGIFWLGEPATTGRLFSLVLIFCGIAGLQLTSPS